LHDVGPRTDKLLEVVGPSAGRHARLLEADTANGNQLAGKDQRGRVCGIDRCELKKRSLGDGSKGARIRVRASQQKFSKDVLPCSVQKAAKLYMLAVIGQGKADRVREVLRVATSKSEKP
jgi:hypothetical protein